MLRYVNTDIVFQEVPDETTLAVNISGCPCHCKGCHSDYLWQDTGDELTTAVLDAFMKEYGYAITCISFQGGDGDPAAVNALAAYMKKTYPEVKVSWYSGRERLSNDIDKDNFDYIKLGPYIAECGGLKSKTTNQRMYRRKDNDFEDITSRFWRNDA